MEKNQGRVVPRLGEIVEVRWGWADSTPPRVYKIRGQVVKHPEWAGAGTGPPPRMNFGGSGRRAASTATDARS